MSSVLGSSRVFRAALCYASWAGPAGGEDLRRLLHGRKKHTKYHAGMIRKWVSSMVVTRFLYAGEGPASGLV